MMPFIPAVASNRLVMVPIIPAVASNTLVMVPIIPAVAHNRLVIVPIIPAVASKGQTMFGHYQRPWFYSCSVSASNI